MKSISAFSCSNIISDTNMHWLWILHLKFSWCEIVTFYLCIDSCLKQIRGYKPTRFYPNLIRICPNNKHAKHDKGYQIWQMLTHAALHFFHLEFTWHGIVTYYLYIDSCFRQNRDVSPLGFAINLYKQQTCWTW